MLVIKMNKVSMCIGLIFLLLLLPIVQAVNLGTVPKKDYLKVESGQTAEFTLLFWNLENSSTPIKLETKQLPEKWTVIIKPEEFLLNQTLPENPPYNDGSEYIGLPIGNVKAMSVKVFVKVHESTKPDNYSLIITTTAGKPKDGISVLLEKPLKLKVNVIEKIPEPDNSADNKSNNLVDTLSKITGKLAEIIASHPIISVMLTVLILIGSWVVFKHE
jgi:hypothetical protein